MGKLEAREFFAMCGCCGFPFLRAHRWNNENGICFCREFALYSAKVQPHSLNWISLANFCPRQKFWWAGLVPTVKVCTESLFVFSCTELKLTLGIWLKLLRLYLLFYNELKRLVYEQPPTWFEAVTALLCRNLRGFRYDQKCRSCF